jgi:hypothetical protein
MGRLAVISELLIGVALIVVVAALVVLTIVAGSGSLAATGLKDIAIALAGGLLGAKVPKG